VATTCGMPTRIFAKLVAVASVEHTIGVTAV
jgi:hypothetical protein